MPERLLVPDWSAIVVPLGVCGWVRVVDALGEGDVTALMKAKRPPWHNLPPEEGIVRQHGRGAYLPMAECDDGVRQLASEVVSGLSAASEARGWPPVPAFNETTWTYYPDGAGHITAHRDPDAYGGVIAVFTLKGAARFRILDTRQPSRWVTAPGDVLLLAGRRWPWTHSVCRRHEVEPPSGGDRMIMTMRFNSRGAGSGYDV